MTPLKLYGTSFPSGRSPPTTLPSRRSCEALTHWLVYGQVPSLCIRERILEQRSRGQLMHIAQENLARRAKYLFPEPLALPILARSGLDEQSPQALHHVEKLNGRGKNDPILRQATWQDPEYSSTGQVPTLGSMNFGQTPQVHYLQGRYRSYGLFQRLAFAPTLDAIQHLLRRVSRLHVPKASPHSPFSAREGLYERYRAPNVQ